jgi:hypothetical protein
LSVAENVVISNELSVANDVTVDNDVYISGVMFCSNIVSQEPISFDAPKISMGTLEFDSESFELKTSNIFIGITTEGEHAFEWRQEDPEWYRSRLQINSDIKINGNFECGSLTIQAFEERPRILKMALENLQDFTEVPNGLRCPGALFTPYQNVFTQPTYFLNDIHLTSNLKIDPVFRTRVIMESNLNIWGKLYGDTITSNLIIADTTLFESNVHFTNPLQIDDTVTFVDTNSNGYWKVFTNTLENKTCDLIFQSRNLIGTAFTDEFDPSIINFTGQHRCTGKFPSKQIEDLVGKIVISTGEYSDLNNDKHVSINEAIPIVKLCTTSFDKRVFGIVSDEETDSMNREFNLGNIRFHTPKKMRNKKYMINSVGEGGVWVCNINGNLENGDYITTSSVSGYGMKQPDSIHKNHTVAKITCDCDFENLNKHMKWKKIIYQRKEYITAFVGCIYKC